MTQKLDRKSKTIRKPAHHLWGLAARILTWLGVLILCGVLVSAGLSLYNKPNEVFEPESHASQTQQQGKPTRTEAANHLMQYKSLPRQGKDVYQLILKGGPFKYPQDGSTFGNYEKLLPQQPQGYYKEYTVSTLQVRHRGERRIVCGGKIQTEPQVCYYTADHYKSFRELIDTPEAKL